MRRFVVLGLLCCNAVFFAKSQSAHSLLDTVYLEEVTSYGDLKKFQSGAKIEKIASSVFQLANDGSLEQLLTRALPVSVKSNAGGLSTLRIRGTSPNHTSLNFGGINLNSLTLGHSNFSNIPLFLFDEVGIQYGSSASVNGSGNIGGAIHLGIQNQWVRGFKTEVRIANGSFGEQIYGARIFAGNGKWETVTRASLYSIENNFPFINPYYRDFENRIFEIEDRQHNAAIENMGLIQEINYRFAKNEILLFRIWYEKDWREGQQNMQTNLSRPDYSEELSEENIRVWADYKNREKPLKYQLGAGYVNDKMVFNGNLDDSIQIKRFIGEAFAEHDAGEFFSYKAGVKAERIFPMVYAYSAQLASEDRLDFYLSVFYRISNELKITANLRQGWVTGYKVPITPSAGASYVAISKENYILNFSANVARGYRVPTFNDRFWVPGGNPDLKPENGMNYEIGANWSYCNTSSSANISTNLFLMQVTDWILWKNGGSFWMAENVQNVESKGVEVTSDVNYLFLGFQIQSGANYSFTSAQRVKSVIKTNALNRQLEYVPEHAFTLFSVAKRKKIDFSVDGSFTGSQYTNEEAYDILDSRFLLNIGSGYQWIETDKHRLKISAQINNVLNTNYQSSFGYAMPGINYRISAKYNFK